MNMMYNATGGKPKSKLEHHQWWKWNNPGVSKSTKLGDLHLILFRDPVDRYISAWNSKVKCCPGTLKPCFPDYWDTKIVPNLLKRNNNHSDLACLPLSDFVLQLEIAHSMGLERVQRMDVHFLPMHLRCRIPEHVPTIVGDIPTLGSIIGTIQGFNLKHVKTLKTHGSERNNEDLTDDIIRRLRALSEPEYEYYKDMVLATGKSKNYAESGS